MAYSSSNAILPRLPFPIVPLSSSHSSPYSPAPSLQPITIPPIITPENANNITLIREIRHQPWELVMALAWSPNGQLLAVAAGENIYLYPTATFDAPVSLPIGAFTHSLAFSPDGEQFASGSRDGVLRIWNVQEILQLGIISPRFAIQAHKKGINSLDFSPDGQLLVTGGNDAVARLWNPFTSANVGLMIGGTYAVPSVAFTPNGTAVAVVNGERIRLREVSSERILGTFWAETSFYDATFSPDGRLIAATDLDNKIRVWQADSAFRTGQETYPQPIELIGHNGKTGTYNSLVWNVAFSPDGRLVVSAGGDKTVRIWATQDGRLLNTLPAHTLGATCVSFSADGRRLGSGGLDGVLRIWEISP